MRKSSRYNFLDKMAGPEHARNRQAFGIGEAISLAGLVSSVGKEWLGGGGAPQQARLKVPGIGTGPLGPAQNQLLGFLPQNFSRLQELGREFGDVSGQAGGALGNIHAGLFDADPNQDFLRNVFRGGGALDALGTGRQQAIGTFGEAGDRLGTLKPAYETATSALQGRISNPLGLDENTLSILRQLGADERSLISGRRDLEAERVSRITANQFGPGFDFNELTTGIREDLLRPFEEAFTRQSIGEGERRLGLPLNIASQIEIPGFNAVAGAQRGLFNVQNQATSLLNQSGLGELNARINALNPNIAGLRQQQQFGMGGEVAALQQPLGNLQTLRNIQTGGPQAPFFQPQNKLGNALEAFGEGAGSLGGTIMGNQAADRRQQALIKALQQNKGPVVYSGTPNLPYSEVFPSISGWGGI